ncbi:hypothetical protein SDC9_126186 [bioreactor metagenome]|uniref:Uncharacterized protein n=1 Tax=bioreactor metagenome TaxID=1076179 RepID=A0A645CQE6_9ZZZZ
MASGRCTSAPVPVAKAIGTNPKLATRAVIKTGRKRVSEPSVMASSSGLPSSRNLLMKEIITMPLSTATPDNAMNPTPAEMDKGMSRNHSAATPPVKASGTPEKTSNASLAVPKVMNSSAKISRSETGTTICNRFVAEINCSNWPPHEIQ